MKTSAANPTRKTRSSSRRSNGFCGPSIRLMVVLLSFAIICVCITAFLMAPVPRVQLNDYVLPYKHLHAMGLKSSSKLKWSKNCDGFGVRQDFYFPKYGGKACGQSEWLASNDFEDIEPAMSKAHLVYKVFSSNTSATEYYEKFWGRHLYERLPPYLYTDVDKAISERVGEDRTAYFWHPKLVSSGMPVPLQAARVPLHVIFIFRQGPTFVRVVTDGFYGRRDEKKLIQAASALSYEVARQVRRAGHKFTPFQQRFYDVQYSVQRQFYAGLFRSRSLFASLWAQFLKRVRYRLRRLLAFFTNNLSSVSGAAAIMSQLLSDVIASKWEFWMVAIAILLLQPLQCSLSLQLSKATQNQLFCKSCMTIHTRGRKTSRTSVA